MNKIFLIPENNYFLSFAFILLLQQNVVIGQTNIIDSLKKLPDSELSKSSFAYNYSMGLAYYEINRDTSEFYYLKALKKTKSDSLLAETHLALGKVYSYKEPRSVIKANEQNALALNYARKFRNTDLIITCLLQLSTSQNKLGKSNLALTTILEAKELSGVISNPEIEYNISNKLGIAYFNLADYQKAISYFRLASTYAKDENQVGMIHINIASGFNKLNNPDSAIANYKVSLKQFLKINRNIDAAYTGLSQAFLNANQFDSALHYCNKWLALLDKANNRKNLFSVYFQYGKIYQQAGAIAKAENYFLKTIEAYTDERKYDSKIRDAYRYLAEINAKKGNYKVAFGFQKEYQLQNDSIIARINSSELSELLQLHEFEKKEAELILEKKEKERMKWQNRALIFTIISGTLIFIYIIFLLVKKFRRYKLNEELNRREILQNSNSLMQNFDSLSKEYNQKKQDLVSYSLQLIHKKELLMAIGHELRKYQNLSDAEREKSVTNLISAIKASLGNDKDWDNFRNYFESIHQDFFTRLNKQYPKLTTTDNRIAALIILGLDNKQAAAILDVEPDSIKIAKNRLKKKLEINANEDLRTKLNEFTIEPN